MKTILKIGMFAAVAALALAGCNNAIKPTEPPADSFAYNADQYRSATGEPFTVSIGAAKKYGDTKTGDVRMHQIEVTFSLPVTKEAVKKGVKCYKLTDAGDNYSMPRMLDTNYDVTVDSMGTKAYLTVNTNDIDYLYVYVTAREMRAVNGALLNSDGDDVWGEKDDDDYARYFDIARASATPLKGNVKYAKETENLNKTLSSIFTALNVENGTATSGSAHLVKKLVLPTSAFESSFLDYTGDLGGKKDALGKFTNVLKNHLKLEQYNWEKATWENIPVSFVLDTVNNRWYSDINVAPNRQLRVRVIDTDKIKLEDLKKFGYPIRYSLKHDDYKIADITNALKTGYVSLEKDHNWPINNASNDFTWTFAADMRTIEITLKPDRLDSMYNLFVGSKWVQLTYRNKDSTKASFFAGFDISTVTKDNFKCFIDKDGRRPLVIKDIIWVKSDVVNYPNAFNKIIISSEDNIAETQRVYISKNVKTASFTGSYFDGTTNQAYEVPQLRFVQTMYSDDPEELYGWRLIKKN